MANSSNNLPTHTAENFYDSGVLSGTTHDFLQGGSSSRIEDDSLAPSDSPAVLPPPNPTASDSGLSPVGDAHGSPRPLTSPDSEPAPSTCPHAPESGAPLASGAADSPGPSAAPDQPATLAPVVLPTAENTGSRGANDDHHNRPCTRSQGGIRKPKVYTDGTVRYGMSAICAEPNSLDEALENSNWKSAMDDEYSALLKNKTWHLVPPKAGVNIIDSKWFIESKESLMVQLIDTKLA